MGPPMAVDLKAFIAEVPDYPKPGISFKDLCPILSSPEAFSDAISRLEGEFRDRKIEAIVAAEARGFLWAAPLARSLAAALVPVRKPKKLPRKTISATYELEYGTDELHMHQDAIKSGQRVLIVDDLLATGGTAQAMVQLVEKLGGQVVSLAFIVELAFLKGREKLAPHPVLSLVTYE